MCIMAAHRHVGVLILFLVWSAGIIATANAQRCRQKHTNIPGECLLMKNCPSLTNKFRPLEIAAFIEDHACGVEQADKAQVLVCCPLVIGASGGIKSMTGPDPAGTQCGRRQVNQGADWPFMVGLGSVLQDKNPISIVCNGVLVSPEWVLTDAFCFSDQHIISHVFLGIGKADHDQIVRVSAIEQRRPQDYDVARDKNGVGLVKLASPVTLTDNVQLACLPPGNDYSPSSPRYVLYIGSIDDGSRAGGFDVTSHWKHPVPLEECRASSDLAVFPTQSHLCSNGLQACNVQMSRPVLVALNEDSGFTVVGVGGLAMDRCASAVTTFHDVSKYLPWIYDTMNPSSQKQQLLDQAGTLLRLLVGRQEVSICGRRLVETGEQWPFVASLGETSSSGSFTSYCTGVVLQPTWLLTDARCLRTKTITHVLAGYGGGVSSNVIVGVQGVVTPPYYDTSRDHNSVALVQLQQPLAITVNIQPACLSHWSSYDNASILYALSSGYGYKQAGEPSLYTYIKPVSRTGNEDCLATRTVPYNAQHESYICTTSIMACDFVASPPVLVEQGYNDGIFTVVGVGGDNTNYCRGDYMGHVRVRPHLQWINSILQPNSNPLQNMVPSAVGGQQQQHQQQQVQQHQQQQSVQQYQQQQQFRDQQQQQLPPPSTSPTQPQSISFPFQR